MKKSKKYLIISASVCMGAGIIAGGIGFLLGGRPGFYVNASGVHSYNDTAANGNNCLEKTKLDPFTSVSINIPAGNIHIIPSDDYYLEYHLASGAGKTDYYVEDGVFTMTVEATDSFLGFNFLSFGNILNPKSDYVNLYVPGSQSLETVELTADMGDITIDSIEAASMTLELSMGDLRMEAFDGNSLTAVMDSGSFDAGTISGKAVTIQNNMGDVTCDSLSADDASITLDMGSLDLETCTAGVLSIENGMGDVDIRYLENTEQGTVTMDMGSFCAEECVLTALTVTNGMGDIDMGLTGTIDDYALDLSTDLGDVDVEGYDQDGNLGSRFVSTNKDANALSAHSDSGSVSIHFK